LHWNRSVYGIQINPNFVFFGHNTFYCTHIFLWIGRLFRLRIVIANIEEKIDQNFCLPKMYSAFQHCKSTIYENGKEHFVQSFQSSKILFQNFRESPGFWLAKIWLYWKINVVLWACSCEFFFKVISKMSHFWGHHQK
jgi:hypothetical protein